MRFSSLRTPHTALAVFLLLLACLGPSTASTLRSLDASSLPTLSTYSTPFDALRGVPYTVTYDDRAIVINGVRTLLLAGSIHYPRFASAEWAHQFEMARLSGLNTVQTYVFWNWHEPARRQYDFESESHQLTHFLDLAAQYGLFVNLRIGPFVCSEWSLGGIPYWMRDYEGVHFRTNDTRWQSEMSTFFSLIMKLVNPWLARNGGPIILAQVENEYDNADSHSAGDEAYVKWCGELATSFDSGLVWGMCQTSNAPRPLIDTCNGVNCYVTIRPKRTQPALWTEHWTATAWEWKWGTSLPHNTAETMGYSTARWFAAGGGYLSYYMFSGGTTFGRWTGGPQLVNSYDYEGPVTEYGLARIDKFAHLSLLHYLLQQYSSVIIEADMAINRQQQLSDDVFLLDYGNALFGLLFFVNQNHSTRTAEWDGQQLELAGSSVQMRDWSTFELLYDSSNVSMSLDVMRAAHVMDAYLTPMPTPSNQTATSIAYIREPRSIYQQEDVLQSEQPLELLALAMYDSDHIFYEASLNLTKAQLRAGTMLVNASNVLEHFHLFFNGTFVGFSASGNDGFSVDVSRCTSDEAYSLTFVVQADGSLNCCGGLESWEEGLLGDITVDGRSIRKDRWRQIVGLQGERRQYYAYNASQPWRSDDVPTSEPFVWYYLAIETPAAAPDAAPFVTYALDLTASMGKGQVWMNGHHLGRYWNITDETGKPTQRYNHAPAAWMNGPGELNELVVWEELGGDPAGVQLFQVTCCDPLN